MRRLLLATGVLAVLAAGSALAATGGGTGVAVSPTQVPALLAANGIQTPPGSCIGQAALPGCPVVKKVVVLPTSAWDSESASPSLDPGNAPSTGYAAITESASPAATGATPNTAAAADACAVKATEVWVQYYANYPNERAEGTGHNQCVTGVGVTYEEILNSIQLYDGTNNVWNSYASCDKSIGAAGEVSCTAIYGCTKSTVVTKTWRGQATGYAVIKGVGYLGVNTSGSDRLQCS